MLLRTREMATAFVLAMLASSPVCGQGSQPTPYQPYGSPAVALPVALLGDKRWKTVVSDDKTKSPDHLLAGAHSVDATGFAGTSKAILSSPDNPFLSIGPRGFEPLTSSTPS